MSGRTLKGHAVVLNGFATWLEEEGYTVTNVLGRMKPPKAPKKVMRTLTDEEIGWLLGCPNQRSLGGSRNTAILLLFGTRGCAVRSCWG